MNRLAFAIFFVAFTTITGAIVVAFLTIGMSEPVHFFAAAGIGTLAGVVASLIISKRITA